MPAAADATRRAKASAVLLRVASAVGHTVRSVPGAAGALLVSYGISEVYRPAGLVVAGVFLLLLDRDIR